MPRFTSSVATALLIAVGVTTIAYAQPAPPPDAEARAALERFMTDRAAAGFSGVVLVARGGTVLLERGYGFLDAGKALPAAADSVFTVGSITKQFTAAAILKLEMQGRLNTADAMAKYLPGVPDDKRAITIHQLLTHTAGLPQASGDDLEPIGRDAFVRLIMSRPLMHTPGTYEYSNVGYSLLAAIVEIVSGKSYETFLSEQFFVPAGMTSTGYSRPQWAASRLSHAVNDDGSDRGTFGEAAMPNSTPGWHLLGNGGILSTVGDMYRWHRALTGDAVLNATERDKLVHPWVDEGGGSSYGYGWSIEETPFGKLVLHNGGNPYFYSEFLRYVDRDVVVYFSTNSRDRAMRRIARPLAQIAFTGRVLDPPSPAFTVVAAASRPAPSGGSASRRGLPAGEGAAVAARLLDAVADNDTARRRQLIPELFSASLVERRGVDALVELLTRLDGDIGSNAVSVYAESTTGTGLVTAVRLRFSRTGAPPLTLTLALEPAAEGPGLRVGGISAELGD